MINNIEKIKREIESLREKIRQADYRYYILNDPEISDKEYDELLEKLKKLEEKYPQFITSDSPTQRVGGGLIEGFPAVRHRIKMLSLDNTYSLQELKEWEAKIKRILKRKVSFDYVVEPKIDGVSCSLTYEKGILSLGSTRGDGQTGEDITLNIKTIRSIPLKLRGNFPQSIEVRGEIYMEKADFEAMNKERAKEGESLFANPRNATSGSLKLLDPSVVAQRRLRCFVHSFAWVEGYSFSTHKDFLDKIRSWGLPVDPQSKYCKDMEEVLNYCLKQQGRRNKFAYEVDGMVIKVNSFSLQQDLGTTLKSPRWAVAYKFPAHQATTRIERIEFGVGRTGIITPVAILKPVECGGVRISRATLHNFDEIERLDIRQKDTVLIERAGEVIPKIIKVITSKRTGQERKIKIPSSCPMCRGRVAKEKQEEVYWYCLNPDCPAQLKRALAHFASRAAMDIEGMGESVIEELIDRGVVKSIVDIYKLSKEDFLKLPLFKEKKANNLILAIENSKTKPLSRFLYGLGIRHVGEKAALILAKRFRNINQFFQVTQADLEKIPEIGPIMASSIINFFASPKTKKMIQSFKKARLTLAEDVQITKKKAITDKTFIFTGELEKFSRPEARKLIEQSGGKWVSSVSRKVDFVVVGKNPGSKYKRAKELRLKIITEAEFLEFLAR